VNTRVKVAQAVSDFLGLGPVPIHTDWNEAIQKSISTRRWSFTQTSCTSRSMLDLLKAGKYVYLEKPMTTNLPDCLEIIRADRAAGSKTMVGFNARYMPLYENLHRLVGEGYIGGRADDPERRVLL